MTGMTAMSSATLMSNNTQSTGLPTESDDCLGGHRA
jgi:hypothetical protein